MNRFVMRFFAIVLVGLSMLAVTERASAVVRHYAANGNAHFTSPNDFVGEGNATHLGLYSEVGYVTFLPTSNPTVLQVDGWAVYTAANGDELRATIAGELDGLTGVVTATITYVPGGTGRFENVSGSSSLEGLVNGGAISVAVIGSIDF